MRANSFLKKIFKPLRLSDIDLKRNDSNKDFNLIFNISLVSSSNLKKISILFEDREYFSGSYRVKDTNENKISLEYLNLDENSDNIKIELEPKDYNSYLSSNIITIFGYDSYGILLDKIYLKLSKSLNDIKSDLIKETKQKEKYNLLLKNLDKLEVKDDILFLRCNNEEIKYCTIYFKNKKHVKFFEGKKGIYFLKEEYRDLYDDINDEFSKKEFIEINYEICFSSEGKDYHSTDAFTFSRKKSYMLLNTNSRIKNRLFNNLKITKFIDEDKKSKINLSFKDKSFTNKNNLGMALNIKSINDNENKSLEVYKTNNTFNLTSNINEISKSGNYFYTKNNKDINNITLSYKNIDLSINKENFTSIFQNNIVSSIEDENKSKSKFYEGLINFYEILRDNFKINSNFTNNSSNIFSESFEINLGSFKKVADFFGYNQEENDKNLDDEINFLKSSIFTIEKVLLFNNEVFDIKTKNFKIEDLFDLKNIKKNTIFSNKSLNIASNNLSFHINSLKGKNYKNLIKVLGLKDNNTYKSYLLKNLEDFNISVEYYLYAIPIHKDMKLIRNIGIDNNFYLKNKIYLPLNENNSDNIKKSSKTLNDYLNQILNVNTSFKLREELKYNFLTQEKIIENNIEFTKSILKNTRSIDNQIKTSAINKEFFKNKELDENNTLNSNPSIAYNNISVNKNKIEIINKPSGISTLKDCNVIIDITDTNLFNIESKKEIRIKYLFFTDISFMGDRSRKFEKIGESLFYSKSYMLKNKNLFNTYFICISHKDIEIILHNKRKFIGFSINKSSDLYKDLDNLDLNYKLLLEYTYIKDDIFIKYQNTLDV
tara:strand:+ start:3391 stop:5871 length:2481 start_codon:yes stop_codon:yes gene_type:complete